MSYPTITKTSLSYPQVVLEGIRGPGIEGDIAIDDVTLEEGECRDPPPSKCRPISLPLPSDSSFPVTQTRVWEFYHYHFPALTYDLTGEGGGYRGGHRVAVATAVM